MVVGTGYSEMVEKGLGSLESELEMGKPELKKMSLNTG